jgi:hypothetical protein
LACTRPDPGFWRHCPTCGRADRLRDGQCARCVLDERLRHLLAGPDGNIRSELVPLHSALRSNPSPPSTLAWLSRSSTSQLLGDLVGGGPLTHQALDELADSKTVRHLRAMLVAAGALPAQDEHLARLEQWLGTTIAAVPDQQDRYLLHRYAIWHHLRRLRRRAAPTGISYGQVVGLRRLATAAITFLELVAAHDLTLATCTQSDLDHWLAHGQVPHRQAAGAFVRWARANKLARLDFPATRWLGPTGPIDGEQRWETARRLLHDDTLAVADRVAGLLVVLYAQRVSAIARLTVDDVAIDGNRVDILLGSVPVALPAPLTALATDLVAARRGHAVTGNPGTSPWLFPGGQPGRPISASRLGERLTSLGISIGEVRTAALFQLATELPAAVLARMLGIHIQVAVQWQRAASADWATYAAELARRGPPHGR